MEIIGAIHREGKVAHQQSIPMNESFQNVFTMDPDNPPKNQNESTVFILSTINHSK